MGLVLFLTAPLLCQSDDGAPGPQPMEDADARQLLRQLDADLKSSEPRLRKEAADQLAGHQNDQFVKPLTKLVRDKDPQVVQAAITALGSQPFKKSQDALLKLVRDSRVVHDEQLGPVLMHSLGKTGWSKQGYAMLRELFDAADKKLRKAILEAFAAQKEVRSFSLFADNLDEPRPADPNSANNPPASYWKERWEEWNYYKAAARRGITTLTGQSFATTEAARQWAETPEARKAGFVYKRGD